MKALFSEFSHLAQNIAEMRSLNEKHKLLIAYLDGITTLDERKIAIRFLAEGAFPSIENRRLGIGHQTIAKAACAFLEINYELVFKTCKSATGSSSETIEKLMDAWPIGIQKREPKEISLKEILEFYEELASTKKKDFRIDKLFEMWANLSAIEIKYMIRIMHQYSLRIGFDEKNILKGLSQFYGKSLENVRYVHMLSGSMEETLEHCELDILEEMEFSYFKPLAFMLASPINQANSIDVSEYVCEEKFDGMRCQVHISDGEVKLFSRDMNEVTESFPELKPFLLERIKKNVILDGEICVFKNDTILPFQLLQKRMGVKKPSKSLLQEYPVTFISYDILALETDLVMALNFISRRKILESFCTEHSLTYSKVYELKSDETIQERFELAKKHGNEGLMLKKKSSKYEYGQRGNSWLKVKKPGGSLDTVILYAHAGSGKRGGLYSDFTLGVRSELKEDGTPFFVPIGKAYGGFTNDELKRLNVEIKKTIADRFGPTLGLVPSIVVELEFEEVQQNKRTKAGYTLRLPRFKAIRWNLSIQDTDSLDDVKALFEEQMSRERLGNSVEPFIYI